MVPSENIGEQDRALSFFLSLLIAGWALLVDQTVRFTIVGRLSWGHRCNLSDANPCENDEGTVCRRDRRPLRGAQPPKPILGLGGVNGGDPGWEARVLPPCVATPAGLFYAGLPPCVAAFILKRHKTTPFCFGPRHLD